MWYAASRTLVETLVMTRSGGGLVGGGSFGTVCPPLVCGVGISDELSISGPVSCRPQQWLAIDAPLSGVSLGGVSKRIAEHR